MGRDSLYRVPVEKKMETQHRVYLGKNAITGRDIKAGRRIYKGSYRKEALRNGATLGRVKKSGRIVKEEEVGGDTEFLGTVRAE